MSTGCLVLGSNSAPVRDAITDGENGFLVESYDLDTLVQRMLEALDYPERFHTQRENARQQMVENYSFEKCLPKLAAFYCEGSQVTGNSRIIDAVQGLADDGSVQVTVGR